MTKRASEAMMSSDRLIITAASKAFGPSLLGLLGSLTLNWPQHPPVLVYDLGLDETTLSTLREHNIPVKKVPPFCAHWRTHYTWKIWCWNNVPAQQFLWLDAGIAVLNPLDEVFATLTQTGYFVIPTYHLLTENASLAACQCCGLSPEFRNGRMTLAAGVIGFDKGERITSILKEALVVALNENCIKATEPMHRHDQAIISLLMHKYLEPLVLSDGIVYGGWISPHQTPGQKIWVHRRSIRKEDLNHFIGHISTHGDPYELLEPPGRSLEIRAWPYTFINFLRKVLSSHKPNDTSINDGVKD